MRGTRARSSHSWPGSDSVEFDPRRHAQIIDRQPATSHSCPTHLDVWTFGRVDVWNPGRICSGDAPAVAAPSPRSALLPASLIDDGETIILMIRPSALFIVLSCAGSLMFIALVAMFLAYLARFQQQIPWISWSDRQAFALGMGLILLRLGWQTLEWWSRLYVLTDRRVIRRMGVLRVAVFQAELKNIQHTSVFKQLRERLFGLGTIGFATAGSLTFDAFWTMIRRPFEVHQQVVQAIRRYGR
jgi:hypothetical protein